MCGERLSHTWLTPRRGSAGHTGPRCSLAACSPTHHDSPFRLPAPGLCGSRSACWPWPGPGQRLCACLSLSLGLCMLSRTGCPHRPHHPLWFRSPLPEGEGRWAGRVSRSRRFFGMGLWQSLSRPLLLCGRRRSGETSLLDWKSAIRWPPVLFLCMVFFQAVVQKTVMVL